MRHDPFRHEIRLAVFPLRPELMPRGDQFGGVAICCGDGQIHLAHFVEQTLGTDTRFGPTQKIKKAADVDEIAAFYRPLVGAGQRVFNLIQRDFFAFGDLDVIGFFHRLRPAPSLPTNRSVQRPYWSRSNARFHLAR